MTMRKQHINYLIGRQSGFHDLSQLSNLSCQGIKILRLHLQVKVRPLLINILSKVGFLK